jgi:3-oxoacyl-[acyl-carrier-protein] synthase II
VKRPVFVRGVGAWTPLADSWPESFQSLRTGVTASTKIGLFDASGFPSEVAYAIPDCRAAGMDPRVTLALRAAREAWAMASVKVDADRLGIFIGAESGRPSFSSILEATRAGSTGTSFDRERFLSSAYALGGGLDSSELSPAAVAARIARELGARGPLETVSLACASGAAAILGGARAIALGHCDAALCGGVGADVDPFALAGFGLLGALSRKGVSRPFDARRDGFVLGEAAAMVVLTSARGELPVEVAGGALTLDGYRLTAPEPSGAAAKRAMRLALEEAGITTVDCVQAHGTSTPLNDAVEAAAIDYVLGAGLSEAHVSSVKGAIGHSIAGAGAVSMLCALEAVSRGVILPTVGLEQPDPACNLPHVLGRAIEKRVRSALVNALAFGGANCSLVLRRVA